MHDTPQNQATTPEPQLLPTDGGPTLTLSERISDHEHAEVYRGSVLGQRAAIKIYRPDTSADSYLRAEREGAAHTAVTHSCVARLLASGETCDGRPYVASAWIDGQTLEQRLTAGALQASETLSILRAVARGLAAIHAQQIIHRDIKPSNIMLPQSGPAAMLLDFGHSLHLTEKRITETSRVLGSAAYMSPEQVQGDDLDGRSDLYSLGIVLFACLTGAAPYQNASAAKTMMMHVHEPVPTPQTRAPEAQIPDSLQDLCIWLMSKRRDDRVPNARVLQLTLDAITTDVPADGAYGSTKKQEEAL